MIANADILTLTLNRDSPPKEIALPELLRAPLPPPLPPLWLIAVVDRRCCPGSWGARAGGCGGEASNGICVISTAASSAAALADLCEVASIIVASSTRYNCGVHHIYYIYVRIRTVYPINEDVNLPSVLGEMPCSTWPSFNPSDSASLLAKVEVEPAVEVSNNGAG